MSERKFTEKFASKNPNNARKMPENSQNTDQNVENESNSTEDLQIDERQYIEKIQLEMSQKDKLIRILEEKIKSLEEKNLLNIARVDNIQKRNAMEVKNSENNLKKKIFSEILEIHNILLTSLNSLDFDEESPAIKSIADGLNMTIGIFNKFLKENNIVRIDEIGVQANSNVHNIMKSVESDEFESGEIVQYIRAGYVMGDVIIIEPIVIIAS